MSKMVKFGFEVPRYFTVVEALDIKEAKEIAHDEMRVFIDKHAQVEEIKNIKDSKILNSAKRLLDLKGPVEGIFKDGPVYLGPENGEIYFGKSLLESLAVDPITKGSDYLNLGEFLKGSPEKDRKLSDKSLMGF